MRILLFVCFTLVFHSVTAQLSCGTDQQYNYLMQHSAAFRNAQLQKKPIPTNILAEPAHPDIVDTIQVVVHIISVGGKIGAVDNPADSVIQNLINGVNKYFNATYPDDAGMNRTAGVDIGVYFKLAQVTASCEPTNGIVRVDGSGNSTYVSSGVGAGGSAGISQEELADFSYWDNTRYLNVWLVNKVGNNAFKGYGYYPTGTRTIFDGVIIYNKGITKPHILAHEIGHSLALYHTFEGSSSSGCASTRNCDQNGDQVCDTDPVQEYTNGCYSSALNPCTLQPFANIVYNHMGYTCGTIFTEGQKSRMRASLVTFRNTWFEGSAGANGECPHQAVKFLSFTAEKKGCNSVQLQWQTTFEQNNKSYAVELSNDGVNYFQRAMYDATGNATDTISYSYNYTGNTNGKIFFRIRQVALDGWSDISAIQEVTLNCADKEYSIYPNPVTQWANITTGTNLNNDVTIYNAVGQKMNQWLQTSLKKFDLSSYPPGVYTMVINESTRLRFIKN